MNNGNFNGRVAIVTGAARGMGEAVARRLVAEGARVCLVDRDEEAVMAVAETLGDAAALGVAADVRDPAAIEGFVQAAVARWGRLDMLHNNAGVVGRSGPMLESDLDDLEFIFAINFRATFLAIKAAVPHLRERGGSIVNMSSLHGTRAARGMGLYGASKSAVIGLTRTLAVELAASNIRVNSVAPGAIETTLLRSSNAALLPPGTTYDDRLKTHPMARAGTAEEAANLIVWLLGDEAGFVSGSIYHIDGALGA